MRCALPCVFLLVLATSPAAPQNAAEQSRLRALAQAGECGILAQPRARLSSKQAVSDLMVTWPDGTSTRELFRSFVNATNLRGAKNGIDLKAAMAELTPRQLDNCFPWVTSYFLFAARDLGETPEASLYGRLFDIYCGLDATRCNQAAPSVPLENCDLAAANPGDPIDNKRICEEELARPPATSPEAGFYPQNPP